MNYNNKNFRNVGTKNNSKIHAAHPGSMTTLCGKIWTDLQDQDFYINCDKCLELAMNLDEETLLRGSST